MLRCLTLYAFSLFSASTDDEGNNELLLWIFGCRNYNRFGLPKKARCISLNKGPVLGTSHVGRGGFLEGRASQQGHFQNAAVT